MKEDWKDIITEERWQKWVPLTLNVLIPLGVAFMIVVLWVVASVMAGIGLSAVIVETVTMAIIFGLLAWVFRWFVLGIIYSLFSSHGRALNKQMREKAQRVRISTYEDNADFEEGEEDDDDEDWDREEVMPACRGNLKCRLHFLDNETYKGCRRWSGSPGEIVYEPF